ncbi:hypothetical protein B0H16DRAFT_1481529 [Mycena metata]|uniref:DUF6532 domain-containing protein n=1 Tax=Mycena metata TaxID=1033252 RepID=A0AAD7GY86_9AGAR|nr:hypothetical protein B0H16DRAFT_1481529 [Mycena metata]
MLSTERVGGRQAKLDAQKNAVWNVDNPISRKRTASTVEVSDKTKKPRKSVSKGDEAEKQPQVAVQSKAKATSSKRKYAAPVIIDSASEAEPTVPALPKSKAAGKVKQVEPVPKAPAAGKVSVAKLKAPVAKLPKLKLPPAKIIADSESDEASSDEDKGSDSNMADFDDANEEEFLIEVPRVIPAKKATATPALESDSEDESRLSVTSSKSADDLFDSEHESIEPRHRQLLNEDDSDDDFPDAPPRQMIEDHGLDEAIADALVSIPLNLGYRSRRSSTASSTSGWSSGHDLRVPDSDAEGDDAIVLPVKKPRKVSAARQKQADLEKPEIRAAPLPIKREQPERTVGEDPARAETTWHPSTCITYPAPGKKDILLNSQTEELQTVLRTGITNVKASLHFESAYPPILARAGFARTYFISAAEKHPEATHILHRLRNDLNFAAILADILLDRINILRGDIKRGAVALTPGLFQFAGLSEAKSKELVEMLLKDHRYIFPVDPKTQSLQTEKPFLHPALSAVIKQGVFNRSFKATNMHLFTSTSKKHPKQFELPDAMVALGATAVYASLVEYRATGERQTIAFTEGAYEDTYQNHMKTLADTRAWAPIALHKVLHELYNQVIDGKSTQPEAGSSATLINLVEVDESD